MNVISAASWFAAPGATGYALSKAAAWSATDSSPERLRCLPTKRRVI
ncbi:hypothetical protein ACSAGD_01270 [Paramicrobacterium sp. CJ85]